MVEVMWIAWPQVCQNIFLNFWENRINFFQNLLLQTQLSECNQIWVALLGKGRDVKLWRSCQLLEKKCGKMADMVKYLESLLNSFKNLPHQTHQSEFYQIWVTASDQSPDKLQFQWSYFLLYCFPMGQDFFLPPHTVYLFYRCLFF